MDQQRKIWGTTSSLFQSPFFSLHLLRIDGGGYCSEHRHDRKRNHFHILSGRLFIHQWPVGAEQDQPDTTPLEAGQSLTIEVGTWHSFTAALPTVCLELYEAAPVEEDIERRTTGGMHGHAPDPNEAGLP
jgi:mannose-6-phosphate isomerase-like protein (cupin superfamily)